MKMPIGAKCMTQTTCGNRRCSLEFPEGAAAPPRSEPAKSHDLRPRQMPRSARCSVTVAYMYRPI